VAERVSWADDSRTHTFLLCFSRESRLRSVARKSHLTGAIGLGIGPKSNCLDPTELYIERLVT